MAPVMRHGKVACLSAAGFHDMAYTEWGPETAARPVVCVHGLTRNARDFDHLAGRLAEAGRRVVCPDVVGRGDSGRLTDPKGYGYPQYLADMTVLLARLDCAEVDWVGTSMGGLIGMMLAAQPGNPIRRLVVNDVGPFVPRASLERIATYVGKNPHFPDLAAAEAYYRKVHAPFGALSDAQWRHMAETSARPDPAGGYRLGYDPGIAAAFTPGEMKDVDLWPLWDRIVCPTLVLRGADSDLLLPETARDMTERGPKAKLLEIAGCGHAPALMEAEQSGPILEWLAGD